MGIFDDLRDGFDRSHGDAEFQQRVDDGVGRLGCAPLLERAAAVVGGRGVDWAGVARADPETRVIRRVAMSRLVAEITTWPSAVL